VAFWPGKGLDLKKLLHFNVRSFKIKAFNKVPFYSLWKKRFLRSRVSIAKIDTAQTQQRVLYSGGFGIDILTLYDLN